MVTMPPKNLRQFLDLFWLVVPTKLQQLPLATLYILMLTWYSKGFQQLS